MTAPATTHPTPRSLLVDAALAYAERGWHVFPLRPRSKRPATPGHPAHACDRSDPRCRDGHTGWEHRATTNPDRITRAWTRRSYGIGIATGPSGLVVVDLDNPKAGDDPDLVGGVDRLSQLEQAEGRALPVTFTVTTPSGGEHRYYRHPTDGPPLANTASRVGPFIDTRAHGGYVVAPPTQLTTQSHYWTVVHIDEIPVLPAWFAAHVTYSPPPPASSRRSPGPPRPTPEAGTASLDRYIAAAVDAETQRLATAAPGTRNNTLFSAAVALGQLVATGALTQDHATNALLDAATTHVDAGAYSTHQAHSTIASGLTRGLTEPRQLPAHLTNDLELTR